VSPTIRISQDTYDHLKEHAEAFVDTPDSVIRRLLGLDAQVIDATEGDPAATQPKASGLSPAEVSSPPKQVPAKAALKRPHGNPATARRANRRRQPSRRAPRGSLLVEEAYELPILKALADRGGSASKNAVIDALEPLLGDQLTTLDRTPVASGELRWRNRAQFVRLRLVERGELKRDSPRGVWELSDAGLNRLRQVTTASAPEDS
jgi:hypothetical protein